MSFALDLSRFAEKTTKKADMIVRKIVIDVGTALVNKSPVGDADFWIRPAPPGYVGGRFRANWQYGLGAPNITTTENIDKDGAATIAAIVGKIRPDAAGKIHYLTNSLPYSIRLEEGWSRHQAPQGMVRLTVTEFRPKVEEAARAINR